MRIFVQHQKSRKILLKLLRRKYTTLLATGESYNILCKGKLRLCLNYFNKIIKIIKITIALLYCLYDKYQ